jgi:hypothetical protein
MSEPNDQIPVGEEDTGPHVDPLELIWALESSDRFERDSPLGGLFHQGQISFREACPRDSMHIIIDRDGVTAHVDPVSPNDDPERPGQYSGLGVLVHNVTGMAADVASVVRGRKAGAPMQRRRRAGGSGRQRPSEAGERGVGA